MKLLHRLSLCIIVMLVVLPLAIMAQDNGQPTAPSSDDDILVPPVPTRVVPTIDVSDIHLAQTATLELIEYPTADLCSHKPNDLGEEMAQAAVCPPTVTPKPRPTTEPTTAIINGLWVLDPNASGFKASGQCQIPGGDNGGMGGEGQPEDLPKVPVCMTGDSQWVKVDNSGPYPLVVPNTYSESQMAREVLESNGETTGSINVTTIRQYRVISPTEIEYAFIRQEQGGCTTTSTVRYKLVEANDLVCTGMVMTPNYTAVPTQMPTPKPGETALPPVTPVPPVQTGGYTIQLPPVDATCKAEQMPPSGTVQVSYDSSQNMFIDFGGGSYTLFWNGSDYYEYRKGNQFMVSVITYDGGASLSWSQQGCFISSPLTQEGAATATPLPVEPTRESVADASAMAGSSFTVTVDTPAYMCAAENKDMLPDLSSASLTAEADNSFTLTVGGTDYALVNVDGIPGFRKIVADGSMINITMNGFYEGQGMGSFMVVGADGKSCLAQLTFKPQG